MQRFKTYGYAAGIRAAGWHRTYAFLGWLCNKITGHEWLDTDWGYGGGGVNVWCRWCNHFDTIPFHEAEKLFPHMKDWIKEIMGKEPPFAVLRPVGGSHLNKKPSSIN